MADADAGLGRFIGPFEGVSTLRFVPNRGSRIRAGGPKAYLRSGSWPDGAKEAESPVAVYWSAEVTRRLEMALEGQSKRAFARDAGVARSTIYMILAGETWLDLATLGTLEEALGVELLPRWPSGAKGPDDVST